MSEAVPNSPLVRLQRRYRKRFDACAMLVYLCLVYVWCLDIAPLGRDYEILAGEAELSPALERIVGVEVALFGGNVFLYHLTNLALLYACTLVIYAIVRLCLSDRPIWFATLAGTLFMANPVHSHGVLNLASSVDLVPALLALCALWAYAYQGHSSELRALPVIALALCAALWAFPQNLGLPIVILFYEGILLRSKREGRAARVGMVVAISAVACWIHSASFTVENLGLAEMFVPLYFVIYPIGFLPETALRFHEVAWSAWLHSAVVIALVATIMLKARSPVLVFAIIGAVCVRLLQGGDTIDPVHLAGGGQLLLATALYSIALVAIFARIMEHPKWRRGVISFTTLLCVIFFVLQVRVIFDWRAAADETHRFKEAVALELGENPDSTVGVLPDYQYRRSAPIHFSAAIAYDTPFSENVNPISLLPINLPPHTWPELDYERSGHGQLTVRIHHDDILSLLSFPYELMEIGASLEHDQATIHTTLVEEGLIELRLTLENNDIPTSLIPVGSSAY